jgi:uncharacterized membrane-anchored protein YitT (DUF2179 family)
MNFEYRSKTFKNRNKGSKKSKKTKHKQKNQQKYIKKLDDESLKNLLIQYKLIGRFSKAPRKVLECIAMAVLVDDL